MALLNIQFKRSSYGGGFQYIRQTICGMPLHMRNEKANNKKTPADKAGVFYLLYIDNIK